MKKISECFFEYYGERELPLSEFKILVDEFYIKLKDKMKELKGKDVDVSIDASDGLTIYLEYLAFSSKEEEEEYNQYLKLKQKFEEEEE